MAARRASAAAQRLLAVRRRLPQRRARADVPRPQLLAPLPAGEFLSLSLTLTTLTFRTSTGPLFGSLPVAQFGFV